MFKYGQSKKVGGKEVGRGVINIITVKTTTGYETSTTHEFKNINTEGAVLELRKILTKLCSELPKGGKKCEGCDGIV